jgi:hypothetical protein
MELPRAMFQCSVSGSVALVSGENSIPDLKWVLPDDVIRQFAIEAGALIDFLSRTHNNLEGRLLEGLSKLFAQNVRVYVYPTATSAMQDSLVSASTAGWQWEEKNGLITADALRPAAPLGHLYSYLIASGFVVPMPSISPPPTTR